MIQGDNSEIIKLMLQKAEEKLITAEIDLKNERYDDSISRAYYAVFHAISAILLSKGLHYSTHSQVIGNFNKEFVKTKIFPKSYTKIIQRLFEERQIGDYDFESKITKNEAEQNFNDTSKIIDAVKNYLNKAGIKL
jgi:uncharacterized protein (UPF0332 family)